MEYQLGKVIFQEKNLIEFEFDSIYDNFDQIATLLWTGSIVIGIVSALFSVILVNGIWVCSVRRQRARRNLLT
jgi:uncharacterized membrane protein SpoIIM required for sporulation